MRTDVHSVVVSAIVMLTRITPDGYFDMCCAAERAQFLLYAASCLAFGAQWVHADWPHNLRLAAAALRLAHALAPRPLDERDVLLALLLDVRDRAVALLLRRHRERVDAALVPLEGRAPLLQRGDHLPLLLVRRLEDRQLELVVHPRQLREDRHLPLHLLLLVG